MKKIIVSFLTFIMVLPMFLFFGCGGVSESQKVQRFHDVVKESQGCMDKLADDIYTYWHDAIYDDKYSGNITLAVYYAQEANKDNMATIEVNEIEIQSLYKEIRNGELEYEVKAVMSAYTDYYEFVVNVSGSFKSYSADMEKYKKELASSLKALAMEI